MAEDQQESRQGSRLGLLQQAAVARKKQAPVTHKSLHRLQQRVRDKQQRAAEAAALVAQQAAVSVRGGAARVAAVGSDPYAARHAAHSLEDWARVFHRQPDLYVQAARAAAAGLWPLQEAMIREVEAREALVVEGGRGAMLCETVGSGKTRAIAHVVLADNVRRIESGRESRFGAPTLVVVPKGLLAQWETEIPKFYGPGLLAVARVLSRTVGGADLAEVDLERIGFCVDIVLTTYDTVRAAASRPGAPGSALFSVAWRRIVVDEGTAVVNESTAIFTACAKVRAERHLFITATPLPNSSVQELNTILAFLGCQRRLGALDADGETARRLLGHFLIRIDRAALGLPVVEHVQPNVILVELAADERAVYDALQARANADAEHSIVWMTTLRKAAFSLQLLSDKEYPAGFVRPAAAARGPSSVVAALLAYERQEMAPGEKALVFCEWLRPLEEVGAHLTAAGVSWELMQGAMTIEERVAQLARLQAEDSPDPRMLLLPYRIGAFGLNMQGANHVVLLQSHWTPALELQAYGRCARFGQRRAVKFTRIVARDTIEEYVVAVNMNKDERQLEMLALDVPEAPEAPGSDH